jgi:hypothetical protein
MCNFALIGAAVDRAVLRQVLENARPEFDTDVPPPADVWGFFPAESAVVCVTLAGCSCALLAGVGLSNGRSSDAHVAGPGYAFRRAVAEAVLRFGEVHLLAYSAARTRVTPAGPARRCVTLGNFLRSGLQPDDGVVSIIVQ